MKSLLLILVLSVFLLVEAHALDEDDKKGNKFKLPLFGMKAGKCPTLDTVKNFNLTAMAGRWYAVYKSASVFTLGLKCGRVDAVAQSDGSMKGKACFYNMRKREVMHINEKWWVPEGAPSGIVLSQNDHPVFGGVYKGQMLAIDYNKYMVGYACVNAAEGAIHYDFVNVLSRTPQLLCPEARETIKATLKAQGIDLTQMLPVEQFECPRETAEALDYEWKFEELDDPLAYWKKV